MGQGHVSGKEWGGIPAQQPVTRLLMGTRSTTPGLERQPVDQSTCQDDQLAMSAICWKHNSWVERVQWRTDPWELMLGNWSAGRWALGGSATTEGPSAASLRNTPLTESFPPG